MLVWVRVHVCGGGGAYFKLLDTVHWPLSPRHCILPLLVRLSFNMFNPLLICVQIGFIQ